MYLRCTSQEQTNNNVMAIKVTLREKSITGGRKSLYLDFYPPIEVKGKLTRREFLNRYIIEKPKTPFDKQHNKEVRLVAEQIRNQRDNDLNKLEVYSDYEREVLKRQSRSNENFIEYAKGIAESKSSKLYIALMIYLIEFGGEGLTFGELNRSFCERFKTHLSTVGSLRNSKRTLSTNSINLYYTLFKVILKQSYKDGYLQSDVTTMVDSPKKVAVQRNYLTIEELSKLVSTDCDSSLIKKAALFSALTGLRFSDIQSIRWNQIQKSDNGGYNLIFTQKKTKGIEELPLSEQAMALIGEPTQPDNLIFDGLVYTGGVSEVVKRWIKRAGIEKKITFHCFRHTFATLQITAGTDIYTVSKLLGHRSIATTQIYAKVGEQSKRKAVESIKVIGL